MGYTRVIFQRRTPTTRTTSADYTYTLASGSGSTDNALFTLESNGTLKAGAVFDYEEQTTRSIRVQVSDEYAATYEEVFVISIGDVDDTAPVITRTGDQNVSHEAATSYTDLGATANDTLDGNLTANFPDECTVDINTPGIYTLDLHSIGYGGAMRQPPLPVMSAW